MPAWLHLALQSLARVLVPSLLIDESLLGLGGRPLAGGLCHAGRSGDPIRMSRANPSWYGLGHESL